MKRFTEYRLTLAHERTLTLAENVSDHDAAARVVDAWFRVRESFAESVILLGLDARNRLIGVVEVSRGGAHGCAITPADVLRPALVMGASAILLAHNHPSEDPTPSPEDRRMTLDLMRACDVVGLTLHDHLTWTRTRGTRSCLEVAP